MQFWGITQISSWGSVQRLCPVSSIVTLCKILIEFHNQDIAMDTTQRSYPDFSIFTGVSMCVIYLCNFTPWAGCGSTTAKTQSSHHDKDPSYRPLWSPWPPSSIHSLIASLSPGNHSSALHLCIVISSQECLYKQNHLVCNFSGWTFSRSIILWRVIQVTCTVSSFLIIGEQNPMLWLIPQFVYLFTR